MFPYKGLETSSTERVLKSWVQVCRQSGQYTIRLAWDVTDGIREPNWCESKDTRLPRGLDGKIPHWLGRGTKVALQGT